MTRTASLENRIWAKNGVKVDPDTDNGAGADLLTVEGGNIDSQGPFSTHFNFQQHRMNELLNEVEQDGILEWSDKTNYGVGSFCKVGMGVYQSAIANNKNNAPASSPASWVLIPFAALLCRGIVKSRTVTDPPATPAAGDAYIIPASATGAWAGKTNQITVWHGDQWIFSNPVGYPLYVAAEGIHVYWNESAYKRFSSTGQDADRAETARDEAESALAQTLSAQGATEDARDEAVAAQTGAETSETNASASASAAATSASDAQTYAEAAATAGEIYDDTTDGLGGTAEGDYFWVPSAVNGELLILYLHDTGGVATPIGTSPSSEAIAAFNLAQYIPEFEAVQQLREKQQAEHEAAQKKAAVVILLGQSLNAARGTKVKSEANSNSYMFTGGAHTSDFQFWSTNQVFPTNWSDVASVVDFSEGTYQSPCVGVASTIVGGKYERCYTGSIAIGARTMAKISTSGPRCNLFAFCHRFAELVRADGYEPEIMFYSAHGEADAFAGTSEADYYNQGMTYYATCQLAASQAMQARDYRAPVILSQPLQNSHGTEGANDLAISTAITRIARDLPNGMDIGGVYQWPAEADRVHPTPGGYVQRGEFVGAVLRNMMERGIKWPGPYITDVALDGTDFYVTFSEEVERDTSMNAGTNLNTANALDGFEWLDNGSFIQITGLTYNGRLVSGTLASTPVGTIEQQTLRIAAQTTTGALTAGSENHPGSQVRAKQGAVGGIYDPTQTSYFWANKQEIGVRSL